jgi:hypothetical protein
LRSVSIPGDRKPNPKEQPMSAVKDQPSAVEILADLRRLQMERHEAKLVGLGDCQTYMADLDDEIEQCRSTFVGAAVTEIAVLRGELSGRQTG